jgi:hypothetical protein
MKIKFAYMVNAYQILYSLKKIVMYLSVIQDIIVFLDNVSKIKLNKLVKINAIKIPKYVLMINAFPSIKIFKTFVKKLNVGKINFVHLDNA